MLLGREAELAELRAALASAREGQGRLLVLSGEAGIGKTRVCDEASNLARAAGFRVVWGRAAEGGGAPPYWPWTQILRTLVDQNAVEISPRNRAHLVEILPELAEATAHGVFDLYEALISTLRKSAQATPLLLLLDDLHAADEATLVALQMVARRLREVAIVLIATHREAEARLEPAVDRLLQKIAREGSRWPLRRLDENEVKTLLGEGNAERAREVFQSSEGNPLFVHEIRRLLPAKRVPDGIRAAVADHVQLLSNSARDLLSLAALLGRDFSTEMLAQVSGASTESQAASLDEAIAAGVITLHDRGASFTHVLLAEALASALSPPARLRAHAAIADLLEKSDPRTHAAAIAHHRLAIGRTAASDAIGAVKRAAEQATARFASAQAAELYARALELVDGIPDSARQRAELLLLRGEAMLESVDAHAGRESCKQAAQLARDLGDPELEARAALAYCSQFTFGYVDPEMEPMLETALAHLSPQPSALRARLLARLAAAMERSPSLARLVEAAREALDYSEHHDDPRLRLFVLDCLRRSRYRYLVSVSREQRHALSVEIRGLAIRLDDKRALQRILGNDLRDSVERGDLAGIVAAQQALATYLANVSDPRTRMLSLRLQANIEELQGRFAEGDACREEAMAVMRGIDDRMIGAMAPVQLWKRSFARGVPATTAPEFVPLGNEWNLAMAGDLEPAKKALCLPIESHFGPPDLVAAMLAELCELTEDREMAPVIARALEPFDDGRIVVFGPTLQLGPVAYYMAALERLMGERRRALLHLEGAVSLCEGLRAEPLLARVLLLQGKILLDEDPARGTQVLARALTIADRLDLPRVRSQAKALLGDRPPVPSPSTTPLLQLERDGEYWTLSLAQARTRLKDSKGLAYLEELVRAPHQEVHVAQLVAAGDAAELGDAGAILDSKARQAYEMRLEDLEEELREAESYGDAARAAKAQGEIDALADQLARAVGLGGRDRRAAALTERSRINVQRRLRDVIKRANEGDVRIGEHLRISIRTGTYCSYAPPS
jgi:hypothetical protein